MYKVFGIKSALLLTTGYLLLVAGGLLISATPAAAQAGSGLNAVGSKVANDSIFSNFHLTPNCDATLPPADPKACNIAAFVDWVKKIINYLFYISIPIATAFILWGAFVMMKAGGNPGEFEKGKKVVLAAIVGIVIIFTSNLIVTSIAGILGATIPK